MTSRPVCSRLALAALFVASVGRAQAPGATAPPQYEVEILVFAHRDFDASEERFDLEPPALADNALEPLAPPVFNVATLAARTRPEAAPPPLAEPLAPAAESPLVVRTLLPEELRLGTEYRKLQAIAAYVPLLHGGWIQPGLPETEAMPFELRALGARNPRGTVRVHLSRFLHVTLDLTYEAPLGAGSAENAPDELREITIAPRYRLTTTRSVRSNELHYFDHPAFGVLVRVTPRAAQGSATGRRPAA